MTDKTKLRCASVEQLQYVLYSQLPAPVPRVENDDIVFTIFAKTVSRIFFIVFTKKFSYVAMEKNIC